MEWLLYATALVLAAGLRLGLAGREPLSITESTSALAALDLTLGRSAAGGAPLADLLTALVFFIAGPSDLAARFPAVLAGVATVALMPFFRPLLGRLAALIAAFLLAIGPFSLAISRWGEADSLAILAALVVLLGLFRFQHDGRIGWLWAAVVAFALLLTAGPRAVTVVIAGAVGLAVARFFGTPTPLSLLPAAWRAGGGRVSSPLGWAVIAALAAFAVVSTRLFLSPGGLALPAVNAWARELSGGGAPGLPLVGLISYDPLAFVFGLVGIVGLAAGTPRESRNRQILGFLAIWAAVGLVVAVLGGQRLIGPLAGIAVPLTLLAATVIADAIRAVRREEVTRGAALLGALPLLVYAYIQSAVLIRSDAGTPVQWLAVMISLALAAGYVLLVSFALGRSGLPIVGLAGAGVLLAGTLHASFNLNGRPSAAEWVLPDVPGPAATIFPELIADLRAARGGVLAYGLDPSLREPFAWYLRDQPGMRVSEGLTDGLFAAIVPAGAPAPDSGANAIRGIYAAGSYGPPESPRPFWRWYVWRTAGETGFRREAVLLSR